MSKRILCSHITEDAGYGKNLIGLSDDNVLDLCENCHAHLMASILRDTLNEALREVFKEKVHAALGGK